VKKKTREENLKMGGGGSGGRCWYFGGSTYGVRTVGTTKSHSECRKGGEEVNADLGKGKKRKNLAHHNFIRD